MESGIIWGKWGDGEQVNPYPLIAHLLDTAATAEAIWDIHLSKRFRQHIGGIVSSGRRRAAFAALSALHDCGKCEPLFQSQKAGHPKQFESNFERLTNEGFEDIPESLVFAISSNGQSSSQIRESVRHENITGHILEGMGRPQWMSSVLSGHHGRYPDLLEDNALKGSKRHIKCVTSDSPHWVNQQRSIVDAITQAVAGTEPVWAEQIPSTLVPFLTGAVILADWMASDDEFIGLAAKPKRGGSRPIDLLNDGSLEGMKKYLALRRKQAKNLVKKSLGATPELKGDFESIFGFEPSRAVQQWAVDAGTFDGLTIVTVPMGEGKTETALWMHRAGILEDGVVFGLPTMATADAMFSRVQHVFKGTHALANLAHGRSILNAFYSPSGASPTAICDESATEGLEASKWFKGRHRALLAPVTVGTCDQVLQAAVAHRFVPVRLAALASKHVILDEIHTYDPYQQHLLEVLLGWLGAIGSRVTLLSATLPGELRDRYLAAYARGAYMLPHSADVPMPENHYPGVSWVSLRDKTCGPKSQALATFREYTHGISVEKIPGSEPWNSEVTTRATVDVILNLAAKHPEARIGVIVNTVDRAINITRMLDSSPKHEQRDTLLLHSRMTANMRTERTSQLLNLIGKHEMNGQGQSIQGVGTAITVVATQIAEASLDIDLDYLITDLCPMPSLLQRLGRQWRHSTPQGNDWIHGNPVVKEHRDAEAGPRAIVLIPVNAEDKLHAKGHFPYSKAVIQKAYTEARNLTEIRIPQDLQGLVDRSLVNFNDPDSEVEQTEKDQHLAKESQSVASAIERTVPISALADFLDEPWDGNGPLRQLTSRKEGVDGVKTRDIDSHTVTVLPYLESGDHDYAYPGDAWAAIQDNPSQQTLLDLLGHTVNTNGTLAMQVLSIPEGKQSPGVPALNGVVVVSVSVLIGCGLVLDRYGFRKTVQS